MTPKFVFNNFYTIQRMLDMLGAGLTLTAAVLVQTDEKGEFLDQRAELVIRKIGHDLLLHAGDSTSRVLSVKRLGNDIFQLEFEDVFSFMPDSLVNIVRRSLAAGELPLSFKFLQHIFPESRLMIASSSLAASTSLRKCILILSLLPLTPSSGLMKLARSVAALDSILSGTIGHCILAAVSPIK